MRNNHFYSCCTALGAVGMGLVPRNAILESEDGFYVNHYLSGSIFAVSPDGNGVRLDMSTDYPYDGRVNIEFTCDKAERYSVAFRIPEWSKRSVIAVNGEATSVESGYFSISRIWKSGDVVSLDFDASLQAVFPRAGAPGISNYAAFRKGCICLCMDNEFDGDCTRELELKKDERGNVIFGECKVDTDGEYLIQAEITEDDGNVIRLVDYASAGKGYDPELPFAAWIPLKVK